MCINVKLNRLSLRALVDTGAKKSCIDKRTLDRLRMKVDLSSGDLDCLYGADGQPIPILGTVMADVVVKGLRMPTVFQVMKTLTYPLILGIDFLQENHATIDTNRSLVTFYDELVVTPFARKRQSNTACVRNAISTTVLPQSEVLLRARIDNHYKLQTSIIEPSDGLNDRKLAMARCIVSPKSYFVTCRLLNPFKKCSVHISTINALCPTKASVQILLGIYRRRASLQR